MLLFLAEGYSTNHIANELGISAGTVRSHIHSMERKVTANGRVHLVLRALEEEILIHEPPPDPPNSSLLSGTFLFT